MVNEVYESEEVLGLIKERLGEEGCVQLQDFLQKDTLDKMVLLCKERKVKRVWRPLECLYSFFEWKDSVKEIQVFLGKVFNKSLKSVRGYYFEWRDYLLLQDKKGEEEGYVVLLDLTSGWEKEAGGYSSFLEDNVEKARIYPVINSLSIVKTTKKTKCLVKYVNHKAEKRRRLFLELKFF